MEKKIFSDEEVFEQIKPASRKAYKKWWKEFKEISWSGWSGRGAARRPWRAAGGRLPAVERDLGPSTGRWERPGAVRRPWKPAWGRPPAMESGLQYLTSRLSKQAWRVWGVWDSLSRPCGGVGGGGGDGKGPIGHPFGPFNGQKSLSPLWKARFSLSTPSMGRVMGFPRLKITMSATFTEYSV